MAGTDTQFATLNSIIQNTNGTTYTVSKACQAIEECVTNNRDNLRAFFETSFPLLVQRVFGYDYAGQSWLSQIKNSGQDAQALLNLLSPKGRLFAAIQSADTDQIIQFIFPLRNLPAHTQELLQTPAGRTLLEQWPQYKGKLSLDPTGAPRILLNVFGFYMFWTAAYTLKNSKGPGETTTGNAAAEYHFGEYTRKGLEYVRGGFHSHSVSPAVRQPYLALLELYLNYYLPPSTLEGPGSSGATSAAVFGGTGKPDATQGTALLSILLEFWLTDVAEPVPQTQAQAQAQAQTLQLAPPGAPGSARAGSMSPTPTPGGPSAMGAGTPASGPLRMVAYQPPSEELLSAVTLLARHVHVRGVPGDKKKPGAPKTVAMPAQATGNPPWLPDTLVKTPTPGTVGRPSYSAAGSYATGIIGPPACSAVQCVSRKLYRFLRRAFAQLQPNCPSLVPLINLWLTIITPWNAFALPSPPSASASTSAQRGAQHVQYGNLATRASTGGMLASQKSVLVEGVQNLFLGKQHHDAPASGGGEFTPEWRNHVLAHLPFYLVLIPRFMELIFSRAVSLRSAAVVSEALLLLRALDAAGPDFLKLLKDAEMAVNRYRESHKKRVTGPLADLIPWIYDQTLDFENAAVAGSPANPPMQVSPEFKLFTLGNTGAAYYGAALLNAVEQQGFNPELVSMLSSVLHRVLPLRDLPAFTQPEVRVYQGPAEEGGMVRGDWRQVKYKGDPLRRPIATNEVGWLVRLTVMVSEQLNHLLGLDRTYREDDDLQAFNVVSRGLLWLRKKEYRVNLRLLAETQTLLWLFVFFMLWWMMASPGSSTTPTAARDGQPSTSLHAAGSA